MASQKRCCRCALSAAVFVVGSVSAWGQVGTEAAPTTRRASSGAALSAIKSAAEGLAMASASPSDAAIPKLADARRTLIAQAENAARRDIRVSCYYYAAVCDLWLAWRDEAERVQHLEHAADDMRALIEAARTRPPREDNGNEVEDADVEARAASVAVLLDIIPHSDETLGYTPDVQQGIFAAMADVLGFYRRIPITAYRLEHGEERILRDERHGWVRANRMADAWLLLAFARGRLTDLLPEAAQEPRERIDFNERLQAHIKATEEAIRTSQRFAALVRDDNDTARLHRRRTDAVLRAYLALLTMRASKGEPPPPEPWLLTNLNPGLEGGFRLGAGYDTNVLRLGRAMRGPRDVDRRSDCWFGASGDFSLSHTFDLPPTAAMGRSLTIGGGAATSHSWHPALSTGDHSLYAGRVWLDYQPDVDLPPWPQKGWTGEGSGLYLGLQYEHEEWRFDRSPSLRSDRLTPALTFLWRRDVLDRRWDNELDRTMLYYTHDWRDDRTAQRWPRLDRDGRYHTIGLQHVWYIRKAQDLPWLDKYFKDNPKQLRSYFYTHEWWSVYGGYAYHWARTDGREYDHDGHELRIGTHVPLRCRLSFDIDAAFHWQQHDNPSYYDMWQRSPSNFAQRYAAVLTWTLPEEVSLAEIIETKVRCGAWFDVVDSNVVDRYGSHYEKSRAVWGVQFEMRWVPNLARGFQRYVPTRSSPVHPGSGRDRLPGTRVRRIRPSEAPSPGDSVPVPQPVAAPGRPDL